MDSESVVILDKIYTGTSIAASGTGYTDTLDLSFTRGYITLDIAMSGDGTATIVPQVSLDPVGTPDASRTFTQPYNSSGTLISVATGLTKTSGPGSNGRVVYPVSVTTSGKARFAITETGGASAITPVIRVAVQ